MKPPRTKPLRIILASFLAFGGVGSSVANGAAVRALPPPEDTPEEILRAEIILEARSPLDGEPLTAAEYAELQMMLAESEFAPTLNSDLRSLIFLLRIRRMLRTLVPPLQLIIE